MDEIEPHRSKNKIEAVMQFLSNRSQKFNHFNWKGLQLLRLTLRTSLSLMTPIKILAQVAQSFLQHKIIGQICEGGKKKQTKKEGENQN